MEEEENVSESGAGELTHPHYTKRVRARRPANSAVKEGGQGKRVSERLSFTRPYQFGLKFNLGIDSIWNCTVLQFIKPSTECSTNL